MRVADESKLRIPNSEFPVEAEDTFFDPAPGVWNLEFVVWSLEFGVSQEEEVLAIGL
jgi:hypothetical protein